MPKACTEIIIRLCLWHTHPFEFFPRNSARLIKIGKLQMHNGRVQQQKKKKLVQRTILKQ